jgi:hypothetical protein
MIRFHFLSFDYCTKVGVSNSNLLEGCIGGSLRVRGPHVVNDKIILVSCETAHGHSNMPFKDSLGMATEAVSAICDLQPLTEYTLQFRRQELRCPCYKTFFTNVISGNLQFCVMNINFACNYGEGAVTMVKHL